MTDFEKRADEITKECEEFMKQFDGWKNTKANRTKMYKKIGEFFDANFKGFTYVPSIPALIENNKYEISAGPGPEKGSAVVEIRWPNLLNKEPS